MPAFNCRQCGGKGRDGISLMALANHHDLHTRSGFLAACADALGRDVPDDGEIETDDQRRERLRRIEAQKQKNAEAARQAQKGQDIYREREVNKARGIWLRAPDRPADVLSRYLYLRAGFEMTAAVYENIRCEPRCTYWGDRDERGFEASVHVGPAMLVPFVNLDGRITGIHQTWIDLSRDPKYRPDLGLGKNGEPLPTKKMRGTKKGSVVPLCGLLSATRWVGGEGIENGLSIAGAEGFRRDTFYFAAGDLGNLAGPADPSSKFAHPELTKEDKRGRKLRVTVPGPVPKADMAPDEALWIPDHVTQLVLLADGDSEPVFTASAMARAEERFSRVGREIETWWPPAGADFSQLMTSHLGIGA